MYEKYIHTNTELYTYYITGAYNRELFPVLKLKFIECVGIHENPTHTHTRTHNWQMCGVDFHNGKR